MKPPAQADLWKIVAARREGILATVGQDGTPQLSNVYYVADPEARTIRVSTTTRRVKGRNLLRDPRAVLHVPGEDFFNFAVAQGTATTAIATTPGDAAIDELHAVHSALEAGEERPAFDRKMIEHGRMVVRISVTRLYGQVFHSRRPS
ncbi:TIGR03618 family F420-dependent PPOX class oxidoreductase [Actinocorallia populi]|uniref:TIGR03618 family F420-dependent PPOX class oxidoreductase n=1 Tax=Actinocorallia populi TaxID=2079200 RepID=UPI000D08BF5A|nr:TIGR03618 family F420-dependent PPOX class oxidoreductase [Actinocorallia populi]